MSQIRSLKRALKGVLAWFYFHGGFFKSKLDRVGRDSFLVLMYHRIVPKNKAGKFLQPGMYVDPETFELHLKFIEEYFNVQSIRNIKKFNVNNDSGHNKPVCHITFDDGWWDFYEYAFPLLKKYNFPATVFLPTDYIGNDKIFWTEEIAFLFEEIFKMGRFDEFIQFISNQFLFLNLKQCDEFDIQEKFILFLKGKDEGTILEILDEIKSKFHLVGPTCRSDFVSWEQVTEMKDSGLISFGSHTVSHQLLSSLTFEKVRSELKLSKECLVDRRVVDTNSVPFCYPNGNYNKDIAGEVKAQGYSLAFTTNIGWNNFDCSVYELNRVGLHEDVTSSIPLLAYRVMSL